MDLAWYLRRLQRMSPAEIGARLRAATIQQAWRFGKPAGADGVIAWRDTPLRGDASDPEARLRQVMREQGASS